MFRKLGFKLIFAVSVAVMLIIGIFAYMNIQSQSKVLLDEVERHVYQLSETVKSSTKYDMLLNRRAHIYKIIQPIGTQPTIKEVRIFNKEGTVIYSSDTTSIGHMVDKKAEACYVCHAENKPLEKLPISDRTRIYKLPSDSARIFGAINPIYNESSCWEADCHAHPPDQTVLGVLDVTVYLGTIDKQIASSKFKMVLLALIAILGLSGIIWFFVKNWVDKPVNALVTATKHVASGNLNYTIDNLGNDELGMLARSFNNMTQKLSEARLQLFQSDKMASLGRLAAGVAHEINNPLTGILTYSSFLLKRAKDNPEMRDDLSVIVRETKRSREIVKGLLDFARQSVPKKNNADINEIINRALSVIENQLTISHIKTVKNLDTNLPKVTVDANQIQQVIINLVDNAAHAIGNKGGTITIATNLISLAPYGTIQVKKAKCPKGHDLIDPAVKIDGMPSIKVKAISNGHEGVVNLDSTYGKNDDQYGIHPKKSGSLEFACPVCSISLIDKDKTCPKCGSPVYFFETQEKGQFEGCTNEHCGWQNWEVVESEGKREYIEIKIGDTGCGIPKENLDKIFDPFFSTKGQKGTGLGLAVIWGILDNHNGNISVDSKVGQGTSFTVRLPAAKR